MLLFKDWDLWSTTCYDDVLVVEDDDYCFDHNGWKCDFYFGRGRDAIEEEGKNERSCIEVLKVLMRKEDEEIEELERELLSLEKELACAENKKWHEFCFDALSEKINWLEVSIRKLKNNHADDDGTQPLLHHKPAEPLHELMEAIRMDYLAQLAQETNGQDLLAKDCGTDPNLTATSCVSGHSDGIEIADSSNLQVDCGTDPNLTATSCASGHSDGIEIADSSNLQVDCGTDPNLTATNCASGHSDGIEIANSSNLQVDCVTDPNLTATSRASGHSDGIEIADSSNLQVSENEEGTRQLVTKETGQTQNSSFSEEMENDPKEAEERNAIVEYDSAYASRVAAAIRGREEHERLSFMRGDSQLSKGGNDGNSALDKKLCHFASESNELIVLDEEVDRMKPLQVVFPQQLCLPSNESSSLKRVNGKRPRQVMNIKNASQIHRKPQTKIISYRRSRLKGEENSQARSKSNMSLPCKPNNQLKMKPDLDAFSDREPSDSTVKFSLTSSTILTSQEQQKSNTSIISIKEDQSNTVALVRKITVREVQPSQHETAGEHAIVPYDSNFSELQKKRKVEAQTSVLQPDKLKNLKLVDLRAIAKQHKVLRYYKLNKGALIEALKGKLSSC